MKIYNVKDHGDTMTPNNDTMEGQMADRIIDVPDEPLDDGRPTEVPHIMIEKKNEEIIQAKKHMIRRRIRIITRIFIIVAAVIILGGITYEWLDSRAIENRRNEKIERIIAELKIPYVADAQGTFIVTDTVNGVPLEMYSLSGLRSSLERVVPDTADKSLVMFMRSADYDKQGGVIGKAVIDGESAGENDGDGRYGMVAVSKEGRVMIDVLWGKDGDVLEKRLEDEGFSFFRQFYLLSHGEPSDEFMLRGKVERAALVNDRDGQLFYVTTGQRETLSNFSEALMEYGFSDAIYLPGGNAYTFWRDPSGAGHSTPLVERKLEKYSGKQLPAPWLVFRRDNEAD